MANIVKEIRDFFDTLKQRSYQVEGLIVAIAFINLGYYLICKAIGHHIVESISLVSDWNYQLYISPIYIIGYVILSIITFSVWCWHRKIPRIPKDKIGILFCTTNSEDLEQHVNDLYEKIYSLLKEKDLIGLFSIKRLPRNIQIFSHEGATKIQRKAGSVIMVWGHFDKGESSGKEIYGFSKVNFTYNAPSNMTLEFHKAVAVGLIGRKFVYDKKNDFFGKNLLTRHLAECSLYIIGMCLIAGEHFNRASVILGALLPSLPVRESASLEPAYIRSFRANIKKMLALALASVVDHEYITAYKEKGIYSIPTEHLTNWDRQIDQAIGLNKRDSRYYITKGIIRFLLEDIPGAKKAIAAAKRLAPTADSSPNFSMAFLHLFSGEFKRAKKEYSSALSKKSSYDTTLLFNITGFIIQALDKYPDKIQLHFALGLINAERQDSNIAKSELNKFINKSNGLPEYESLNEEASKRLSLIQE
jgi:hypothetical protein